MGACSCSFIGTALACNEKSSLAAGRADLGGSWGAPTSRIGRGIVEFLEGSPDNPSSRVGSMRRQSAA